MNERIRVALVDDQTIIRKGLIKLFEIHPHIQIVCEANDGKEIIEWFEQQYERSPVDVVLMDIQMPTMDGFDATEILVQKYENLRIIGLSSYDNEVFIDRFISCGGRGYLLKVQEVDEIVSAIEQVLEIGYYLSDRVPISKIRELISNKEVSRTINEPLLSSQEIKIVRLICEEKTSQEIADLLFISKKTVESHRDRILQKIKAKNMIGIAIYAIKNNLIDLK
jgi:DNA-binding NarL/FixJ family response regulator